MVRFDETIPAVHIVPPDFSCGSLVGGCSDRCSGDGGARGLLVGVVERLHQLDDLGGETCDLGGKTLERGVEGWEALVWLASDPGG